MSGNLEDGKNFFINADETDRVWFYNQWAHWPKRINRDRTTNLNFMYGAILAYRDEFKREPKLSNQLESNVRYLDKYNN